MIIRETTEFVARAAKPAEPRSVSAFPASSAADQARPQNPYSEAPSTLAFFASLREIICPVNPLLPCRSSRLCEKSSVRRPPLGHTNHGHAGPRQNSIHEPPKPGCLVKNLKGHLGNLTRVQNPAMREPHGKAGSIELMQPLNPKTHPSQLCLQVGLRVAALVPDGGIQSAFRAWR